MRMIEDHVTVEESEIMVKNHDFRGLRPLTSAITEVIPKL